MPCLQRISKRMQTVPWSLQHMLDSRCLCWSTLPTLNLFLEHVSPNSFQRLWRYTQKSCRISLLSHQAASALVQTAPTVSVLGHLWRKQREVNFHGNASVPSAAFVSGVLPWAAAMRNNKFHTQSMMSKTGAQWFLDANWALSCWYVRWASDCYSKILYRFAYDWEA